MDQPAAVMAAQTGKDAHGLGSLGES